VKIVLELLLNTPYPIRLKSDGCYIYQMIISVAHNTFVSSNSSPLCCIGEFA